ncbi:MAG: hypothetical protein ACI4M3_06690 [Acutalibacteraceae bacterium]
MNEQDVSRIFNSLSAEQRKKIEAILADKEQTNRILSSPQAAEILKKLSKDKPNG